MTGRLSHKIHRAPVIDGAIPATAVVLCSLLEKEPNNKDALFSLANLYLRSGLWDEAIESFLRFLSLEPENAEARSNLALAYEGKGDIDNALIQLKQAVLLKAGLFLAQYHLGRLLLIAGDKEGSAAVLNKAIKQEPSNVNVNLLLAQIELQRGELTRALSYYRRVVEVSPDNQEAANALARYLFEKGEQLYNQGEFEEALSIWADAFGKYPRAFIAEPKIRQSLARLVEEYCKTGQIEAYRSSWEEAIKTGRDGVDLCYPLFLRFYFSLGMQPEFYVPSSRLAQEELRWQSSSAKEVQIEFHRFRLGVVYTYQGRVEEAVEQFAICDDRFPASKKDALRLARVLSFLRDLEQQLKVIGKECGGTVSQEWEESGFVDVFQRKAWSQAVSSPEQALRWKELGFSPAQCSPWSKSGIEPQQAREWLDAGFDDPGDVVIWLRGGLTVSEAKSWSGCFGKKVAQAIECKKAGFADPELAERFSRVFMFPFEAIRWFELGFDPKEAALWLANGVSDPFVAKRQQLAENELEQLKKEK